MMHKSLLLAALMAVTPSLAFAHAGITPTSAAAGATVRLAIALPHGCDGAPTDTVSVKIPEGFVSAKPQVKPGWQIAIDTGAYAGPHKVHGEAVTSGALAITWSGGSIPDDEFDEFVVMGTLDGVAAGTDLPFVVTQKCGAATVTWDQIAPEGTSPHSLQHPAPTLDVTEASADAHDHMAMSMPMPAAPVTIGDLEISGGFARATLPNAPVGGGYVTIVNHGSADDRLVSASTPIAKSTQLHDMKMEGDVMKMNALPDGVPLPAGGTVTLSPSGLHIMMMGLTAPLVEGQKIPVTLTFEKAGTVTVDLDIGGIGANAPADAMPGMDMGGMNHGALMTPKTEG